MRRIKDEWRWFDETMNMPYPWYTSSCLKFLETQDLTGKRIFEYGVGDSTLWYRLKGAFVYGVDDNEKWADKVGARFTEDKSIYIQEISGIECDIIVIDGIYRDECTKVALEWLKPGGFLIIDNYKQPSVQAEWPITEKLIEGMDVTYYKEPGHYDWQTIIVRK